MLLVEEFLPRFYGGFVIITPIYVEDFASPDEPKIQGCLSLTTLGQGHTQGC